MKRSPKPESPEARAALSRVRALGLEEPEKPPGEQPEWPRNLSDLTDEELGEHLAYWTAMLAYAGFEVARCDVERKAFEASANVASTKAYLESPSDKVTDRRVAAQQNAEVVEARERHGFYDAMFRMLKALADGYEQRYAAVSRELTRRLGERYRGRDGEY